MSSQLLKPKSKTKGRQKVEFSYMEDKVRRGVTFCKRKQGLLKKAMELNKLTGAQIVLIVLSENNQVHKYLSDPLLPLENTNLYHDIKSLISRSQGYKYELGNGSGNGSGGNADSSRSITSLHDQASTTIGGVGSRSSPLTLESARITLDGSIGLASRPRQELINGNTNCNTSAKSAIDGISSDRDSETPSGPQVKKQRTDLVQISVSDPESPGTVKSSKDGSCVAAENGSDVNDKQSSSPKMIQRTDKNGRPKLNGPTLSEEVLKGSPKILKTNQQQSASDSRSPLSLLGVDSRMRHPKKRHLSAKSMHIKVKTEILNHNHNQTAMNLSEQTNTNKETENKTISQKEQQGAITYLQTAQTTTREPTTISVSSTEDTSKQNEKITVENERLKSEQAALLEQRRMITQQINNARRCLNMPDNERGSRQNGRLASYSQLQGGPLNGFLLKFQQQQQQQQSTVKTQQIRLSVPSSKVQSTSGPTVTRIVPTTSIPTVPLVVPLVVTNAALKHCNNSIELEKVTKLTISPLKAGSSSSSIIRGIQQIENDVIVKISIAKGALLSPMGKFKVDAVVNPTNSNLSPTKTASDKQIIKVPNAMLFRKNTKLIKECEKYFKNSGHLKLTQAVITSSFDCMNCNYIIHCLPPTFKPVKSKGLSWQNKPDVHEYKEHLEETVKNVLDLASEKGLKTIVIPLLIMSGSFFDQKQASNLKESGPTANRSDFKERQHISAIIKGVVSWIVKSQQLNKTTSLANVVFKPFEDTSFTRFKSEINQFVNTYPPSKTIFDTSCFVES